MNIVREQYQIHSAYGVVLCAVVEQVANFPLTKYPTDARGESEVAFEDDLTIDRRVGLTLVGLLEDDIDEQKASLEMFCRRMESLGGLKLLDRGPSRKEWGNSAEDGDDDGEADGPVQVETKTSFSSDRRIIRLIVARYWADQVMHYYAKQTAQKLPEP